MAQHFGQEDVNKYKKFKKVDGATYRRVNQFLRKRTYITAREWAIARLCTDFRTRNGAEMTFIGQHLPELVPFMEESYTPQAVNQARDSFKKKVYKSGATFFYGAMCGFFTSEELDDLLFEASEVARFLLEVERSSLDVDEEIDIEDRISEVMRSVGEAAAALMKAREEKAEEQDPGAEERKKLPMEQDPGAGDMRKLPLEQKPGAEERKKLPMEQDPGVGDTGKIPGEQDPGAEEKEKLPMEQKPGAEGMRKTLIAQRTEPGTTIPGDDAADPDLPEETRKEDPGTDETTMNQSTGNHEEQGAP